MKQLTAGPTGPSRKASDDGNSGTYNDLINEQRKDTAMTSNPSVSDYAHWNEEASIIKAQEDRYADYYAEPSYDDGGEDWE